MFTATIYAKSENCFFSSTDDDFEERDVISPCLIAALYQVLTKRAYIDYMRGRLVDFCNAAETHLSH